MAFAILCAISIAVMVGWMGYSTVIYRRHRKSVSLYPFAASAMIFGLAYVTSHEWVTAVISLDWGLALIGWQQARDALEFERSRNQQMRDAGIEWVGLSRYDP
jgi:predicted MFS family arabinose efflux permease